MASSKRRSPTSGKKANGVQTLKKSKPASPAIPSYLKWLTVLILAIAIIIAFASYYSRTQQTNSQHTKTNEAKKPSTQTTKKEETARKQENISPEESKSSKPLTSAQSKMKKENSKEEKNDSISNKVDESISKELKKAEKLLEKGKLEDALKRFGSLLDKHPNSPRAQYGQAQALDKLSEQRRSNDLLQQAIDAYSKVPNLPDSPLHLKRLALLRVAERLNFFGQMRKSSKAYEKLASLFPGDVEVLKLLGVSYLMYGNNNEGKKVFKKILEINPNNGFAKSHLGFILKSELKYEESIPLLMDGIHSGEPNSGDGRFYFHLGDALNRIGKPEEAYSVYVEGANKGIFLSPLQRSLYNADTPLRAKPWWEPQETGYINAIRKLEKNWRTIRDEGLSIMDQKTGGFIPEEENLREKGDWKQFTMYQQGRKLTSNCRKTPKTCEIMDSIPESIGCRRGQVKFSVMHPGTHIWPHTGPTNCRIRAHLGLKIPESVAIRVGKTTRTWKEGKVVIIDDSIEHEVWHNGTSFRLILIVDFWHPDLTERQKATLSPI